MSDFLNYVERNYGCVAEYNRCMEEDAEYRVERGMRVLDSCARNKAKLEAAGDRAMWFCEDCIGCKYYEMVGPTSPGFGYEDIDDVEHGICHHRENPFRPDESFCKGREEGEYNEQTT